MDYPEHILKITTGGGFEITSKKEVTKKVTPKIGVDNAIFLIYDWPDDKEGANTSIIIALHYSFILNDKKYEISTKNTFYDFDNKFYNNLQDWFFKDMYPLFMHKALEISKEKIEKELGVSFSNTAPFNTQETKAKRLANKAAKNYLVDTI
ncbi:MULTISPECIES: hypothetical protein [unclassified Cellulophaga]|uniref:hypothetical protein n=1 Tax=unclassified Cellulophaga TaxID=2634405 RepID=UPI0026E13C63|nr:MULTISPECIES: hypothetical protein [unclassified Cellulophaga]MDO6490991.1 hypothetical protein [Cellulophaga sp. 2_MG-2023]MDO6493815.1 hypothetical protein [Cellulophaga sp. 3_MG-2023]